jgi:hypothetical protein
MNTLPDSQFEKKNPKKSFASRILIKMDENVCILRSFLSKKQKKILYTKALSKMRAIIKNKKLLRTIQLNYKIH